MGNTINIFIVLPSRENRRGQGRESNDCRTQVLRSLRPAHVPAGTLSTLRRASTAVDAVNRRECLLLLFTVGHLGCWEGYILTQALGVVDAILPRYVPFFFCVGTEHVGSPRGCHKGARRGGRRAKA